MSAYVIVQVEVTDWEKFEHYLKEAPGVIAAHGGQYRARGGQTVVLEGKDKGKRIVLIEFPSLLKAQDWYHSREYQEVKKLRAGAATGSIIAVEGC